MCVCISISISVYIFIDLVLLDDMRGLKPRMIMWVLKTKNYNAALQSYDSTEVEMKIDEIYT